MQDTVTPVRPVPVAGELTGSWLRRLAAPYGLGPQDLLRGLLRGPHHVQVTGSPAAGLEVFLNGPAQSALARSVGLPPARLAALLPSLADIPARLADATLVRAGWHAPRDRWVGACHACTGRLRRPGQPVLVYPGPAGQVCRRHRRWLLAHSGAPAGIGLETLPDILAAHRQHLALMRRHPDAEQAVAFAAAVVWSWQLQGWQAETIWKDRARRAAAAVGCAPAVVEPHALLAYPETVTVARVLAGPHWQQRLRARSSLPGATADALAQEIGHRIGRPWLADWLRARAQIRPPTAAHTDPLRQWIDAAAQGAAADRLWSLSPALSRPPDYSGRAGRLAGRRRAGVLAQAQDLSMTGGWEPVAGQTPCAPVLCA